MPRFNIIGLGENRTPGNRARIIGLSLLLGDYYDLVEMRLSSRTPALFASYLCQDAPFLEACMGICYTPIMTYDRSLRDDCGSYLEAVTWSDILIIYPSVPIVEPQRTFINCSIEETRRQGKPIVFFPNCSIPDGFTLKIDPSIFAARFF